MSPRILLLIICSFFPSISFSGEVAKACSGRAFPVLELEYRRGQDNFNKIKASDFGKSALAVYLHSFYKKYQGPQPEEQSVSFVFGGNQKFVADSGLKQKFLNYATTAQRTANPNGYRASLIELVNQFFPNEKFGLRWFLSLQDPILSSVEFRPASGKETGEFYGAIVHLEASSPGKFSQSVIVSNYESEPVPYLIPLIIHELVHASSYKEKIPLLPLENERKYMEYLLVEEAKAFDAQMHAYLELVKQQPDLFCDWLYVTYSYGEIPVPLSWTMASMEKQMKSGSYIFNYAKMGSYKDRPYLLNAAGTDLRADLKAKIRDMNLTFVK